MARKSNSTEPSVSGAAPARQKRNSHAKHTAATFAANSTSTESPVIAEPELQTAGTAVALEDQPSREEVAALAYSYWQARGCQGGSPEEDWLRAEEELRNRLCTAQA